MVQSHAANDVGLVSFAIGTRYFIEVGQYDGTLVAPAVNDPVNSVQPLAGGTLNFHITSFYDVPGNHAYWNWVEQLHASGITGGCATNPTRFCPDNTVTRAQMAVFLLRGIHDSTYFPPAAIGNVFSDVPASHWAAAWIEQLALEKITSGCGSGKFCPENNVTRAQMAVFLLRAKYGFSYTPPPVTSTRFTDVPGTHWAAAWIEQLAAESITGGCSTGKYCPGSPVTRDQMAVFLVRTFGLATP